MTPKINWRNLLRGEETADEHVAAHATGDRSVLDVSGLTVDFWTRDVWFPAVKSIDFTLARGEVLAIVGESGSGKSTTAMAMLGLLPPNARVGGSINLRGRELVGSKPSVIRSIRGNDISVIFQEPMTAMNPVYTIGFQIAEVIRSHKPVSPKAARARAIELLDMVDIPNPAQRADSYPHQLSGGQRQRAMIAMALANDPGLLIADEPTTALDVTVQAEILELMRDLRDRIDAGILLITHDMGVVADIADRVVVMKDGNLMESGSSVEIYQRPQAQYTRDLLAAVPHLGEGVEEASQTTDSAGTDSVGAEEPRAVVLDMRKTIIEYPGRGSAAAFRAVDEVDLRIHASEVVGLVGESGSGKSTIGRAVVGLLPPTGGEMDVVGTSMISPDSGRLRRIRDEVAIVFQDPGSSLNPRFPIGDSIGEPLRLKRKMRGEALNKRVEELLDQVSLSTTMRNRYPHELSGGQRQRVGIARALALSPKLLVADEPTSALDVSVQATVLELFAALQRQHGFACLFISHDLAVVEQVSDRIAVMNHARLVEVGATAQVLNAPREEYTKRLLAAVPVPDPQEQRQRRADRLAADLSTARR
ncbi:ABC transporter ATP-binding protein [Gordonia sp. N1V]|uniref:ABC transporter ATP-binding protein n=1 Tax=Gordonia sp. N1V TaxID=3034163 RepID=UPI0023E26B84|nr:ABC transporter ATP-binding protein [Gordonia sp. N1V]MDF3280602.1 ABC transporter ATP-binding protein [Gordonia sp. N1V]